MARRTYLFIAAAIALQLCLSAASGIAELADSSLPERRLLSEDSKKKTPPPREDKHKPPKKGGPGCEGDPHFTGADHSYFDFSGVPNTTYCLISDPHFHVNAYFGGYYGQYGENPSKSITWMRKVGILWGQHKLLLEARSGPSAEYLDGYMANVELDGQKVSLSAAGDKATFSGGRIAISWMAAKEQRADELIDVFAVDIKGVVSMILELRPEIPQFRTETDGTVHFDVYLPVAYLSDNVHGILGQTFRSDHKDRFSSAKRVFNERLSREVVAGENGEGYLDGTPADYEAADILSPDCRVTRFLKMDVLDPETALAMELSSGGVPSVLGESAAAVKLSASSSTYRRMMKLKLMKRLRLL